MTNSLGELNNRSELAARNSELEDRLIEIIQSEEEKKNEES